MIRLRSLPAGATLAVTAPAFPADAEKIDKGIRYLEGLGYRVRRGKTLTAREGYLSGDDTLRAGELNAFFADEAVDGIICARGGWGTLRLLDKLDFELITRCPKMISGYSDITTLQLALLARAGLPSFSGPMVAVEMANGIEDFTAQHFWGQINNRQEEYRFDLAALEAKTENGGRAEGPLIGGCLSLISHLLGTPYMPDVSGSIFFIEDVGEEPYKMDRYLAHLRQAGVFERINGLIIGQFLDCEDARRPEPTIHEVIYEYIRELTIPVIYDFPYGHGMRKVSMPIGARATLDTTAGYLAFENPFCGT